MTDTKLQQLKNVLQGNDERSVSHLLGVYNTFASDEDFIKNLISITKSDHNLQNNTTWLLKYYIENNQQVIPEYTRKLISLSEILAPWEAKLHLLQMLPYLKLEKADLPYLDVFINQTLKSDNKFVRAWAYHGLYEMSKILPQLKEEVRLTCERALEEEAPSVKARVRKILKELNK